VVEFGPLNASIHQVDERVRIEDIERLTGSISARSSCCCRATTGDAPPR